MIMKTNRFRSKFREFSSILRNEYRHIFHDAGVILIVIGAIFIYSTAYSLAYKNEVLRNVPVAVVDNSHTAQSRQLVRALDATPNLRVAYKSSSLEEAKRLFHERKINGIIVIPSDYEKKIMRNERVNISIYADASYFLMYRQVFFDVMGSVLYSNSQIEWVRFVAKGAQPGQAAALSNPVQTTIENMYNPYGGYATFIPTRCRAGRLRRRHNGSTNGTEGHARQDAHSHAVACGAASPPTAERAIPPPRRAACASMLHPTNPFSSQITSSSFSILSRHPLALRYCEREVPSLTPSISAISR